MKSVFFLPLMVISFTAWSIDAAARGPEGSRRLGPNLRPSMEMDTLSKQNPQEAGSPHAIQRGSAIARPRGAGPATKGAHPVEPPILKPLHPKADLVAHIELASGGVTQHGGTRAMRSGIDEQSVLAKAQPLAAVTQPPLLLVVTNAGLAPSPASKFSFTCNIVGSGDSDFGWCHNPIAVPFAPLAPGESVSMSVQFAILNRCQYQEQPPSMAPPYCALELKADSMHQVDETNELNNTDRVHVITHYP